MVVVVGTALVVFARAFATFPTGVHVVFLRGLLPDNDKLLGVVVADGDIVVVEVGDAVAALVVVAANAGIVDDINVFVIVTGSDAGAAAAPSDSRASTAADAAATSSSSSSSFADALSSRAAAARSLSRGLCTVTDE